MNNKLLKQIGLKRNNTHGILVCSDNCNTGFVIKPNGGVECGGCGKVKGNITPKKESTDA